MTDGNSKKNKTKILKKQKYIGGSTLSNNEIKIIENQLASANKSAVIAEIKSNELETMVDQIAEAEKDPTKSANLDVITKEMVSKADAKHNKAKRLLFQLLENYIERWWD